MVLRCLFRVLLLPVLALLALPGPVQARTNLSRLGPERVVSPVEEKDHDSAAVAWGAGGSYLAVWRGPGTNDLPQVFGRILNLTGSPRGGVFQISSGPVEVEGQPQVAAVPGGGFAVIWISQGVWVRYYAGNGQPGAGPVRVDSGSSSGFHSCDVAVNSSGETLAVWSTGGFSGLVLARRLGADGAPLGNVLDVAQMGNRATAGARVGAAPDGDFLVVWGDGAVGNHSMIQARRLDASGIWGAPFLVSELGFFEDLHFTGSRPLFRPDGSFSVAWMVFPKRLPVPDSGLAVILGRSFNAAGLPGPEVSLRITDTSQTPAADLDPAGNVFIVTDDSGEGVRGRLYDPAWNPLSEALTVSATTQPVETSPAVAANATGNFLVLWHEGHSILFPFPVVGAFPEIFGQLVGAGCAADTGALCLGPDGRFEVRATWETPDGATGIGHAVPLTADTGALWFFGDQNLELIVKVLDGRPVNGHFWVYAGALSNVEYRFTVTDTLTGQERTNHNPPGQFVTWADTQSFEDEAPLSTQAAASETFAVPRAEPLTPPLPLCSPSPTTLCYMENFISVTVEFTDPRTGLKGTAQSIPLTGDTGSFWFFGPSNLELMVKVLDGRSVNGHLWIFFGALSDLEYTVTVTEHSFGQQKVYRNRRGSWADLGLF